MLAPSFLFELLKEHGTTFFAGVPDSLLKDFCAYLTDHTTPVEHIIPANEGSAVALAAGHHLATGGIPLVYMQNSGLGNALNPLLSLADPEVYAIPMLLLIGWRGEPGVKDEPQHVKQGKVTPALLEAAGIPYAVLSGEEAAARDQVRLAYEGMKAVQGPYALLVRKDTFSAHTLRSAPANTCLLSREEALKAVAALAEPRDIVVATTGMISRELHEDRTASGLGHARDFLTVGSMGHASQIALAIALHTPGRRIFCFDGDGAALMHLGGFATIGAQRPSNLVHIVFNNGAHDSVGGQPTAGFTVALTGIALSCGYVSACMVDSVEALASAVVQARSGGPCLIEVRVRRGARKDLGRPTSSPVENKAALMRELL